MKRLIVTLAAAGAMCVPLTGRADENRINLWPLAGYDDGALDIIWPLGHFKDSDEWRFFPVVMENSFFCVFPEFWFWNDAFAVLPFGAKYDFSGGTLFPVWWWNYGTHYELHSLFPAYYYHRSGEKTIFWAGCGLGGWREELGDSRHWLLPLYFKDSDGTFVTPLYGCNKNSRWCFPLWYGNDKAFYSALWCHEKDDDGSLRRWVAPLLLSGGRAGEDGTRRSDFLLGLGGAIWNGPDGSRSSWAFPFYYENGKGELVTPLFGRNRDEGSHWMAPFYYTDGETFVSLPYARTRNDKENATVYVIPPLLSGYAKYDDGGSGVSAFFLYGHGENAKGETTSDWLFPLYHYNGENGNVLSIPCGRIAMGSHTNAWWATPLVGTRSGSKTGGWLFPLFNREKDAAFDRDLARMEAKTIPADIRFSPRVHCTTNRSGKVCCWTNCVATVDVRSKVSGSVLVGSDHDHSVTGSASGGKAGEYVLTESKKHGNRLVFNRQTERTVTFDIASRSRKDEKIESETMALCGLFCREQSSNAVRKRSYVRTRILWKLWDREEKDGNVTVDAFPGFTYDAKTDGCSKTSCLWRLYRYEKDAKGNGKLDLLFLPILR